ncbi:hypothetical protein BDZ89DRAFT_1068500 [Hymenopellis radicata]|nr:hypothetical protein BDZ89DRAFT_1068500 [Hymenopellis radicata]
MAYLPPLENLPLTPRPRQNLYRMDEEMADVFYLADFDEDGRDMPGLLDVSRACGQYQLHRKYFCSIHSFPEFGPVAPRGWTITCENKVAPRDLEIQK